MRPLSELINTEEPAWPDVKQWIAEAKNPIEVLPANDADSEAALLAIQVTTRSPMGAIVYETGNLYHALPVHQSAATRAAASRDRSHIRNVQLAHR